MKAVLVPRLTRVGVLATISLIFGACALAPGSKPSPDGKQAPATTQIPLPGPESELPVPPVNPMADVRGDRPLPAARGKLERFDCMTGVEDEHARIAFEARGGQVTEFAYYSKWKPRTCSVDVRQDDPRLKWRLTPEGATRVHTPIGIYVIRTQPDAYVFEFHNVQRTKACGMMGTISGTMTVKRIAAKPVCSAAGIMDRGHP